MHQLFAGRRDALKDRFTDRILGCGRRTLASVSPKWSVYVFHLRSGMKLLPDRLRDEFRRNNELDYSICEYCLGRNHEARGNA